MKKWKNIIIHCSDSGWGSAAVIRGWHLENGWRDIGYHFVILNGELRTTLSLPSLDGDVSVGRVIDGDEWVEANESGAHALGMNSNSIGICLIGVDKFTEKQYKSLIDLLYELHKHFNIPVENMIGHYETPKSGGKTCPNMDMNSFRGILSYEFYKKEHGNIPKEYLKQWVY